MPRSPMFRAAAFSLMAATALQPACAADPAGNSALDAPLFYQLLIGEIELRTGQAGNAYEVMLDAARRTKDEALFRRAIEIALSARAGDQALAAARAWRTAQPSSVAPLGYIVQLLVALNRPADLTEPLRAWLSAMPADERPAQISTLPRLLARSPDRKQIAAVVEPALQPYLEAPETRTASAVAIGRLQLAAGEPQRALELVQRAHALEPAADGPALLALEMMPSTPAAEAVVTGYLATQPKQQAIRMIYARVLSGAQRYSEALTQLQEVTRVAPETASAWLSLGALQLELKQPADSEASLRRYLEVASANPQDEDDDGDPSTPPAGVTQALLMLAQGAEQQGDYVAAEQWLARVDNPKRALEVQVRRASLLARQGQVAQARELVRAAPERGAEDGRAKMMAEAQLLRDVKHWSDAYDVLDEASKRFPDNADVLYEQAMVAERMDRLVDMERLLRRVMEIKPDHHHAYNALGYSLADRNQRLVEARELIRKALSMSPGEPFITDSLGWVEYRMGNRDEALRLLREAYRARPDVEIAAHLGEVLWVSGEHEEARRIWRDARTRDGSNEVLRETLARLRVDL